MTALKKIFLELYMPELIVLVRGGAVIVEGVTIPGVLRAFLKLMLGYLWITVAA